MSNELASSYTFLENSALLATIGVLYHPRAFNLPLYFVFVSQYGDKFCGALELRGAHFENPWSNVIMFNE